MNIINNRKDMEEYAKAGIDSFMFGTGVVHVGIDLGVEHVPIQDFFKKEETDDDDDRSGS